MTTQNLVRLSNRIRMIRGRPLFANFVPEEMIMGHMREYTTSELDFLLRRAGFNDVKSTTVAFPDHEASWFVQKTYAMLCKLVPGFANFLFCVARK